MSMEIMRELLDGSWSRETARSGCAGTAPASGQCAVTALLVQDLFGGQICRMEVPGHGSHYFSRISDRSVDLTADQFDEEVGYPEGGEVERETVLRSPDTERRYRLLVDRFDELADRKLSVDETEHVAIRTPGYVAGSSDRPEVSVFSQTRSDRIPLHDARMAPRQAVWMKWVGGPIVARSRVLSWHTKAFEDANVNHVRELTAGTRLFELDDYWKSVQDRERGWTTVVRLRDEEWLDDLVFPVARSRGSSWVFLDTPRKKVQWLSLSWDPDPPDETTSRNIPMRLRFEVMKRDDFTCRYCNRRNVDLHVDHVVPWVMVREHRMENLVTACSRCNLGKSDLLLTDEQVAAIVEENRRRAPGRPERGRQRRFVR